MREQQGKRLEALPFDVDDVQVDPGALRLRLRERIERAFLGAPVVDQL
jgi:hypothetical protein